MLTDRVDQTYISIIDNFTLNNGTEICHCPITLDFILTSIDISSKLDMYLTT